MGLGFVEQLCDVDAACWVSALHHLQLAHTLMTTVSSVILSGIRVSWVLGEHLAPPQCKGSLIGICTSNIHPEVYDFAMLKNNGKKESTKQLHKGAVEG